MLKIIIHDFRRVSDSKGCEDLLQTLGINVSRIEGGVMECLCRMAKPTKNRGTATILGASDVLEVTESPIINVSIEMVYLMSFRTRTYPCERHIDMDTIGAATELDIRIGLAVVNTVTGLESVTTFLVHVHSHAT